MTFNAPVTVEQDLGQTNLPHDPKLLQQYTLFGAYVPDGAAGVGDGVALVSDVLPVNLASTLDDAPWGFDFDSYSFKGTRASFVVKHFSGYILAGKRSGDQR